MKKTTVHFECDICGKKGSKDFDYEFRSKIGTMIARVKTKEKRDA